MATQHEVQELQQELESFPNSTDMGQADLRQQVERLGRLLDRVDRAVQDERAATDDGSLEDAIGAMDEARQRLTRATDDQESGEQQTMFYNMAQASLSDALDDLMETVKTTPR